MIEAIKTKPGCLGIVDVNGERHTVNVDALGSVAPTAPGSVFITFKNYSNLLVRSSVAEVREAAALARKLRKALKLSQRCGQMEFDFDG